MKVLNQYITPERKLLYLWANWFFLANTVLLWLVSYKYLATLLPVDLPFAKPAGRWLVEFFIAVSYTGHFALISFLICWILVFPLISLIPKRKIIIAITIIIATWMIMSFIVDSYVYQLYRFHLSPTILHMIFGGHADEVLELSTREWVIVTCLIVFFLLLESITAWLVWHKITRRKQRAILSHNNFACAGKARTDGDQRGALGSPLETPSPGGARGKPREMSDNNFILKNHNKGGKKIAFGLGLCVFYSYFTVAYTLGTNLNVYSVQVKALPFYNQILARILPVSNSSNNLEKFGATLFTQTHQAVAKLNYPRHPLLCTKPKKPLNIIFLVLDTWRTASLNKAVMPNTMNFISHNMQFKNHYSGGNSTLPGVFSLFYSIPSNYWSSALQQKQAPVFLNLLQQYDYQMGIYASAELKIPEFNQTAFVNIKNLRVQTPGTYPAAKDRYVTKEFEQFIKNNKTSNKPFFLFLFYDAAHGYCRKQDFAQPFQPALKHCNRALLSNHTDPQPYINRYNNAVHFDDQQIGIVLQDLQRSGLMSNTIIVLTGDHGQEFNETHRNYWEHASNFTAYQVKTPLIIHWPGKTAQQFNYITSHYDITPTLMEKLFSCKNPYNDYSLGYGLFNNTKRPYLLVGSYISFGIIEPERITVMYPSGTFQIEDLRAKPLDNAKPHYPIIRDVLNDMRMFYEERFHHGV